MNDFTDVAASRLEQLAEGAREAAGCRRDMNTALNSLAALRAVLQGECSLPRPSSAVSNLTLCILL